MLSSEVWCCVGPVKTNISEECVVSIFRVEIIHIQGRALAVG
jgi:hypothetical protein